MAKINVANFIKDLAEKAGFDSNDQGLIDFLSHTELNKIEIASEITTGINKSLISLNEAKNNHPTIKSHYFGEFMSNLDRGLDDAYVEAGLDADTVAELNKEKSSTKRVGLLGKKVKEIIETSSKTSKKPSEAEASLNQQINDLNEKLRQEKEARKTEGETSKAQMNKFRTGLILNGKTGSLKTVYDNLPGEVRTTTIETLLNKELQDSNATFVLEENGNLKLQKQDGSNYFDESNRQLNVDDFISKTLAKHKVLVQSAPNSENTGAPAQTNGQPAQVTGGQKSRINVSSLMAESLQGLEAEPTKMI